MEVKAVAKFVKMAPRKIRLVTGQIRNKKALEAMAILKFNYKLASKPVSDVLKNAISIAKSREMDEDKLIISQVYCNEGPRLKRGIRAGRGHWRPIHKQMSHITVILVESKEETKKKPEKKATAKAKA